MEFVLLSDEQKQLLRPQLLDIMTLCDKDFVPPLSARQSTSDQSFCAETVSKNGVLAYLEDMLRAQILAAIEGDKLLGFVAFKRDVTSEIIGAETLPNLYICTLMLSASARGKGLASQMYAHLFDTLYPGVDLYTRTWSTNAAHLKILTHFGFSLIKRIENDRGEGIDTVYYGKKRA